MILQIMVYAIAVAAVLGVAGLCLERLAALQGLPRRGAWIVVLLLSVLLPVIMILRAEPAGVAAPAAAPRAERIVVTPPALARAEGAPDASPIEGLQSAAPRRQWHLPLPTDRNLLQVWAVASILTGLYLAGANIRLRRRISSWRHATLLGHPVLVSESMGPALVGIVRPCMVVPRWLLQEPVATQSLILEHELQHIAARDPLLIRTTMVLLAVLPWNLPLWWQWRRLRQAIEMDCDARVLRAGASAESYGEALLAVVTRATRMPAGVVAMSEPVSALELRIQNLLPDPVRHAALQTAAAIALLIIGVGAAVAMDAPAIPKRVPANPAAQAPPPAAAKQNAPAPEAKASPRPAPRAATSRAVERPVAAVAMSAANAPELQSVHFQINYATAKDLVAFIKSAPGIGLLSEEGSIAVDENTNTFLVHDAAANIATIRQLVARLDVPARTFVISAVFALVDSDLVQQLIAGEVPNGAWSPVTDLGPEQAFIAALDEAQASHRAEVISRPRILAMNRSPASLEQGGVPYPQGVTPDPLRKELRLKLSVTPTLRPDQRVTLDVDTTMTFAGTVVITAGGTPVPSIDSIQVKNQVLLNSGATIMLDLTKERTGRGAGADAGRRLVAFVTPTLVSAAAAPSR